ncbi:unnamed protein product [Amoebophrya sp. A25]|nr:unnamed protein product [Amoebophrya sp. A25]|eukprot:GSA25T00020250001.1
MRLVDERLQLLVDGDGAIQDAAERDEEDGSRRSLEESLMKKDKDEEDGTRRSQGEPQKSSSLKGWKSRLEVEESESARDHDAEERFMCQFLSAHHSSMLATLFLLKLRLHPKLGPGASFFDKFDRAAGLSAAFHVAATRNAKMFTSTTSGRRGITRRLVLAKDELGAGGIRNTSTEDRHQRNNFPAHDLWNIFFDLLPCREFLLSHTSSFFLSPLSLLLDDFLLSSVVGVDSALDSGYQSSFDRRREDEQERLGKEQDDRVTNGKVLEVSPKTTSATGKEQEGVAEKMTTTTGGEDGVVHVETSQEHDDDREGRGFYFFSHVVPGRNLESDSRRSKDSARCVFHPDWDLVEKYFPIREQSMTQEDEETTHQQDLTFIELGGHQGDCVLPWVLSGRATQGLFIDAHKPAVAAFQRTVESLHLPIKAVSRFLSMKTPTTSSLEQKNKYHSENTSEGGQKNGDTASAPPASPRFRLQSGSAGSSLSINAFHTAAFLRDDSCNESDAACVQFSTVDDEFDQYIAAEADSDAATRTRDCVLYARLARNEIAALLGAKKTLEKCTLVMLSGIHHEDYLLLRKLLFRFGYHQIRDDREPGFTRKYYRNTLFLNRRLVHIN